MVRLNYLQKTNMVRSCLYGDLYLANVFFSFEEDPQLSCSVPDNRIPPSAEEARGNYSSLSIRHSHISGDGEGDGIVGNVGNGDSLWAYSGSGDGQGNGQDMGAFGEYQCPKTYAKLYWRTARWLV